MTTEENLQAGIAAARAGDLARAASFFARVVKEDPGSEQGWFLLASCLSDVEQRKFCYRRALALNPGNTRAARKLDELTMATLTPVSPFLPSEPDEQEPREAPEPDTPPPPTPFDTIREEPRTPYRTPEIPMPPREEEEPKPTRKSSSMSVVWISAFASLLILCGLATAFLMATGRLDDLPTIRLFNRAPPAAQYPTTTPFAPIPTSTSTPDLSILPTPRPTVAYTPRFEEASCPFEVFANADVRCGYVIVPEDRSGDPSDTIRLLVAVYKSLSDTPEPDPVVFLQGGPGAEAVELSGYAYSVLVYPFLDKRDSLDN